MFDGLIWIIILIYVSFYAIRRILDLFTIGNLSERPVLITGCDSGFGHDLAIKCVMNKMPVFAGCLTKEGIDEINKEVQKINNGSKLLTTFLLDVSKDTSVQNAKLFVEDKILNKSNYKGLYAVVNNAGIVGNNSWDDWLTPEDYEKVWQINTLGVIRVTHAFKNLIKRAKGRFITVASVCGRVSLPGVGPYSVSKYGVEAYCDVLRLEMAQYGVKVSLLEPGFFKTPITNIKQNTEMLDKLWTRMSVEKRGEYGKKFFDFTKKSVEKSLSIASSKTELVVEAYFHAITSIFPRKRYQVGNDCHFFFIPFSFLPADIQDWLFWLFALIEKPPKPEKLY